MKRHLPSLATLVIVATSGLFVAHSQENAAAASHPTDREKLVGTWHLAAMEDQGADGKTSRVTNCQGLLVYTADGHIAVQVMYPASEATRSDDYVRNGYEASFGSFDVDEAAHTVTHHVQATIVPKLIGKDLPRAFRFSGNRLIIQSTGPDEHWAVTWERY